MTQQKQLEDHLRKISSGISPHYVGTLARLILIEFDITQKKNRPLVERRVVSFNPDDTTR